MQKEIKPRWVNVDPDMARRWLATKNIHNRPMKESTINAYALDMKRNQWAKTHQAIAFDEDGNLVDGQHRLAAIVLSGKTIEFLIVQNLPKMFTAGTNGDSRDIPTQLTFDQGCKRTIGDQLSLAYNLENSILKAAIVAAIVTIIKNKKTRLSAALTHQVYSIYKTEIEAVVAAKKNVRFLTTAVPLAVFSIGAKCFPRETLQFEEKYFSGEELTKNSPILLYRNYMLNRTKDNFRRRATEWAIAEHGANCLMYHILQQDLRVLRQTDRGIEFFAGKQKKAFSEVAELVRL